MATQASQGAAAGGWLVTEPVPVVLAVTVLLALLALALLRHFFGAIKV
jgi:hypothetical protein